MESLEPEYMFGVTDLWNRWPLTAVVGSSGSCGSCPNQLSQAASRTLSAVSSLFRPWKRFEEPPISLCS